MLLAAILLLSVQEDDNPVLADYVTCVVHQVEKLYKTPEPANNVARTAMHGCQDKESGLKASVRDDLTTDLVKGGMSVHDAERAANKQIGDGWTEYMLTLEHNTEETILRFRARLQQR